MVEKSKFLTFEEIEDFISKIEDGTVQIVPTNRTEDETREILNFIRQKRKKQNFLKRLFFIILSPEDKFKHRKSRWEFSQKHDLRLKCRNNTSKNILDRFAIRKSQIENKKQKLT